MADDIFTLSSRLYVSKPENASHYVDVQHIVHVVPFWLKHTAVGHVAHLTQCYALARELCAVTRVNPVTCVFCLAWDGMMPVGYDIAEARI